jgi:hypothetical protein
MRANAIMCMRLLYHVSVAARLRAFNALSPVICWCDFEAFGAQLGLLLV